MTAFDNPVLVTNLELQPLFYDYNGDSIPEPREEVIRRDQGAAVRVEFSLGAATVCDPADALCREVHGQFGFPNEVGDGIGRFMIPLGIESGESEFRPPSVVELGLTGMQVGQSPSIVELMRESNKIHPTVASTTVQLDPQTLVVAVDVVYVLADLQTPVDPNIHDTLPHQLNELMAERVGVLPILPGEVSGGMVDDLPRYFPGKEFAQALFDLTPANTFHSFTATVPAGSIYQQERVDFEWQPERLIDPTRNLDLLKFVTPTLGVVDFVAPDSLWVQCGVQFRLRSIKVVHENRPEMLFLDQEQTCTDFLALRDQQAREWGELAGISPTGPAGVTVFFPYRMRPQNCGSESTSAGTATTGYAIIPVSQFSNNMTIAHELGHTLGLNDLFGANYCFQDSDASNAMCSVASNTGFHMLGCDTWRSDGVLPPNCVPEPTDAALLTTQNADLLTCQKAREIAAIFEILPDEAPLVTLVPQVLECYEQSPILDPEIFDDVGGALVKYTAVVSDSPTDPRPGWQNPTWQVRLEPPFGVGVLEASVQTVRVTRQGIPFPRLEDAVDFGVQELSGRERKYPTPDIDIPVSFLTGGQSVIIPECTEANAALAAAAPTVASICPNTTISGTVLLETGETLPVGAGELFLPPGAHFVTWVGDDPLNNPTAPLSASVHVAAAPPAFIAVPNAVGQACNSGFALTPPRAADECGPVQVSGVNVATGQAIDPAMVVLAEGTHTIEWTAQRGATAVTALQTVTVTPCMVAAINLVLADQTTIIDDVGDFAPIVSAGDVSVGSLADVGTITSGGDVVVHEQATVHGDVRALGGITVAGSAQVLGTVSPNDNLVNLEAAELMLESFRFRFTGGDEQVMLTPNAQQEVLLPPGIYGSATINPGTTLILTGGGYVFRELVFYSGSHLRLELGEAPTRVAIADHFFWQGIQDNSPQNAGDLLFIYDGVGTAFLEAPLRAAVAAPNGFLRLAPLNQLGIFSGIFVAGEMQVQAGTTVELTGSVVLDAHDVPLPPDATCDDEEMNGDEEGVDCGGNCPSACPECVPATYQAENMFHSTGGSIASGWNVWSNGYIAQSHQFVAGPSTLTVVARGQEAAGVWPQMVARIGGTIVGDVDVNTSDFRPYTFSFVAENGSEEIRVEFANDFYQPPADRNLIVDQVQVGCGGTPAPLNLQGALTIEADWGSGYCATLHLHNAGSSAVSSWQASLSTGQSTISQSWNANFSGNVGLIQLNPFSWNATIAPGASVDSVGFCADRFGTAVSPGIVGIQGSP